MELIRYISEEEYQTLVNNGEVLPHEYRGRAWSGRNKVHLFPRGFYSDDQYNHIAYYLDKEFDLGYKYRVVIKVDREEYITFSAYDKEQVDRIVNIGEDLEFDIDEDIYDTGAVYVVPEVRLPWYSYDQVIEVNLIKK